MKYTARLFSSSKNTTLIKYFLSYFIILSILFLGFFLAVRLQLNHIYFKDLKDQTDKRLTNVMLQLDDDLSDVNQVHSLLSNDINLVLSRYKNENWYNYQAAQRMNEYTVSNSFIDTIVYVDNKTDSILSSGKHVYKEDGIYYVYTGTHYLPFPMMQYTDSNKSQLIFLSDETSSLLLYLPYNSNVESYSIFYVISAKDLQTTLETGSFNGITSVCLVTSDNRIVSGIHTDTIRPYLDGLVKEPGCYPIDSDDSMFVYKGLPSDLSLLALSSNKAILDQVSLAFRNTYMILVLLAACGIILILCSMRITYWPLHRLLTKLVDKPLPGRSYVDQIDAAFTTALSEKKELQKKLDKYRLSMQKSILDSIVSDSSNSKMNGIMDIDQFFSDEPDNMIFVIKISLPRKNFNANEVVEYLENALPDKNSCALLEAGKAHGIFMINYPGIENNKDEVIRLLLSDYCRETGCTAAVSNGASSPLEIPYLYENALLADKYRQDAAVVSYTEIAPLIPSPSNLAYPYKNLDALALCLKTPDFKQAHELKKELFSQIDSASENGTLFPDFFIRCVLIDILTIIINAMNRMNIKFKNYSDLYFETLYLCRSCPYQEKGGEISRNVDELLATFEAEYANSAVHAAQIMEILQECYTSPDFSISVLADKFEVSIAYMSYLFKKKFNKNFSDYLWELRLAKAKDMLLNTSMPIDQISISVGYINVSSFRRKFKQEIGITPSQFRNGKG